MGDRTIPAYMIVMADIRDRDAFIAGYGQAAAALVAKFGGTYLLRAPGAECLEGRSRQKTSMVISKWPDRETAMRFWNSPEYADVKRLRENLADVEVLLIEGPDLVIRESG